MKEIIEFDVFAKIDIRTATVVEAHEVPESEKLIRLILDVGSEVGKRQVFAGIKKWYKPEDLVGKQVVFLANLKPKKMMGSESQGMLLAVDSGDEDRPVLIVPIEGVENGLIVR